MQKKMVDDFSEHFFEKKIFEFIVDSPGYILL